MTMILWRVADIRWAIALTLALLGTSCPVHADTPVAQGDAIQIELPALPGFGRYLDLLAHPAYLALALENNGMAPSLSKRITVLNSHALKMQNAFMRYTGHKGSVYIYSAGYTLDLGTSTTDLTFPVTIDVGQLSQGKVTVRATPPLAKLFPKELVERARTRAETLSDRTAQQSLLSYLDDLGRKASDPNGNDSLFEAILVDAYNRAGTDTAARSGHDVGEAEPLSDQWMLIATLAIWVVIVPAWLFLRRIRAARANPA
jgi:hypothetical protein